MKEDEYRSAASAEPDVHDTIIAEDGSYRIVRPESGTRSYTDAHFRAAEDLSDVPPRYYEPEPVRRREKKTTEKHRKTGIGTLIAVALICSLLGGLFGAGIATITGKRDNTAAQTAVADGEAPTVNTVAGAAVSTASFGFWRKKSRAHIPSAARRKPVDCIGKNALLSATKSQIPSA